MGPNCRRDLSHSTQWSSPSDRAVIGGNLQVLTASHATCWMPSKMLHGTGVSDPSSGIMIIFHNGGLQGCLFLAPNLARNNCF